MDSLCRVIGPRPQWEQLLIGTSFTDAPSVTVDRKNCSIEKADAAAYAIHRNRVHPCHYRFEVREGDETEFDKLSPLPMRNRAEIAAVQSKYAFGQTVWCSYWVKPIFSAIDAEWTMIGQWHATEDAGDLATNPFWKLQIGQSGKLQVMTAGTDQDPVTEHTTPVLRWEESTVVQSGVWRHVLAELTFSESLGAASCKTWIDGAKVVDLTGIDMGSPDAAGPYFKFGIYRRADGIEPMVAEYAQVEWGTSDLSGRAASPLPRP